MNAWRQPPHLLCFWMGTGEESRVEIFCGALDQSGHGYDGGFHTLMDSPVTVLGNFCEGNSFREQPPIV